MTCCLLKEETMTLPVLDLKQNTPEWHQWRAQGFGASDIAALYGKHPYLTEYQLWLQKTGQAEGFKGNVATKHGQREEPKAMEYINSVNDQQFYPICITHAIYPHIRASLDGFRQKNKIGDMICADILEIKCPYCKKDIQSEKDAPAYWIFQVNFQSAILRSHGYDCGKSILIWNGSKSDFQKIEITHDIELEDDMIEKAHQWWQHHVVMGNPVKPDTILLSQQDALNKLSLYEEYQSTAKIIDEQKRALKCEIEAYLDGQSNYHTDMHQIIRIAPRTSYDFNQMRLDGIDLNKYKVQNSTQSSYIIKSIKKRGHHGNTTH